MRWVAPVGVLLDRCGDSLMNRRNDLVFRSEVWEAALEKFAEATGLTVNLFDRDGSVAIGPVGWEKLFQLFRDSGSEPELFAECARRCLRQSEGRAAIKVVQRLCLGVVGTSLILEDRVVGAVVAGYAFTDFVRMADARSLARQSGTEFDRLWRIARGREPVPPSLMTTYGKLLQALAATLLKEDRRAREYQTAAEDLQQVLNRRTAEVGELSASLLHAQDDERRRIARELHDGLGQLLADAKVGVEIVCESTTSERERHKLGEVAATLDQCSNETRAMSYLLHPPLLDEMGFRAAARIYTENFSQRTGIQVGIELPSGEGRLIPAPAAELALFRVLQESLTNAHRHSRSGSVDVYLTIDSGEVALEIKDYGRGMSAQLLERFVAGHGGGVGLSSMRARIKELGGRLEIQSDKRGTLVRAVLPLPSARQQSASA
jgi:signal transduction histidine kinase